MEAGFEVAEVDFSTRTVGKWACWSGGAITRLPPGWVFVFGSNRIGVHGAGAARVARDRFGAIPGVGEGLMGRSYALPTKDRAIRTLALAEVQRHVERFLGFAAGRRDLRFLVTEVGCGLAGYRAEDIAPMFEAAGSNVMLPEGFAEVLQHSRRDAPASPSPRSGA